VDDRAQIVLILFCFSFVFPLLLLILIRFGFVLFCLNTLIRAFSAHLYHKLVRHLHNQNQNALIAAVHPISSLPRSQGLARLGKRMDARRCFSVREAHPFTQSSSRVDKSNEVRGKMLKFRVKKKLQRDDIVRI
jgi:hypothetical protein